MNKLVQLTNPHFIIDMMYARSDNMVERAVYSEIGYGNKAYMHIDVKEALLKIIPFLEENNLKMRICDAYHPPLAHQIVRNHSAFKGTFFCRNSG